MESLGVMSSAMDVRHEPVLSSMSPSNPSPLRASTSSHPDFVSGQSMRANLSSSSRRMISSPLRTCSPVTSRPMPPPPPIDTSQPRSGSPLQRVPTEPASAAPPPQQPTADELAVLGVKVRDFAFEPSTLPQVPTVRKPYFRELKRQREETLEEKEARKRNEQRRLEFNSPRIKPLPTNGRRTPPLLHGVGGLSFIKPYDLPFNGSGSSSSLNGSPASGLSLRRNLDSRLIQSQPVDQELPFANPSSHSRSLNGSTSMFFTSCRTSPSPPHITLSLRTQEFFKKLPKLFDSDSQSGSQSQSQSQSSGSQHTPLPALSISQTDSEWDDSDMDDEEYVKTPLVTPNGSLIYPENDDIDMAGSSVNDNESSDEAHSDTVMNTSALPESQVAELLASPETGSDVDVSASQMGFSESQDLSQQVWQWQQQSQSQFQSPQARPPDLLAQSQDPNADMSVSNSTGDELSICDPTPTPSPTLTRTSSTRVVTAPRSCASANSNNSAASSQTRPLPRVISRLSLSRRLSTSRILTSASSHSLLRRDSSLSDVSDCGSVEDKGRTKNSPINSTVGKARYNLRSPSPKKAKLLGGLKSSWSDQLRLRNGVHEAAMVAEALLKRPSKSTARKRARSKGKAPEAAINDDTDGLEISETPDIQTSPTLRRSVRLSVG